MTIKGREQRKILVYGLLYSVHDEMCRKDVRPLACMLLKILVYGLLYSVYDEMCRKDVQPLACMLLIKLWHKYM